MKLKSLELFGFKSFVDKTLVQFDEGITGIVGPNGCGKCVHGDTRIPLADGSVLPIRDLIKEAFDSAEEIQQMDDGAYTYDNPNNIEVLTLDPSTMKMGAKPVLAFVRRTSPETLLKIKTRAGREIVATKYHPLFILDQGSLRPVRADELHVGLFIASPRHLPISPSKENFFLAKEPAFQKSVEMSVDGSVVVVSVPQAQPLRVAGKMTSEWGRFLGYILSEGQNSKWSDQVRFVNADQDVLEDFSRSTKILFGKEPTIREHKKGSKDAFLFSSILCDLLDKNFGITRGGHSSTKRIPVSIFTAADNVVWSFLSALIEGDGCIRIDRSNQKRKNGIAYLEYASASEGLVRDLATLFLRFGIRALVRSKKKRATNSNGSAKTYYSLYIYGADALKKLAKNLSLVSYKKQQLADAASLTTSAASLDTVPSVAGKNSLFDTLWKESAVSINKEDTLRGRIESYREGRCAPSRKGLSETIRYIRDNAKCWNKTLEERANQLEKIAGSGIYWDEVTSIDEIPSKEEWVYDLCVEQTHNFVANDLVVHNSNIVDSIRWVMGEQSAKHLRGVEMQDVIFNGTSSRPPLGMSQVTLTFDVTDGRAPAGYTDYSEIQVERRLYRSGESEYYINKVPCRLRDIVDLFLGTGVGTKAYSIIEQGRIDRILSAKPEERRLIIEEAAGISKFKHRKEAALRKIESTETNLARLSDIVSEIKRQLNSLDRQAKKAERYKQIFDELKERELQLSSVRYQQLSDESDHLEAEGVDLTQNETSLAASLSQVETENEKEKLNLATLEQEVNNVQEKFYMQQNGVKLHETSLEYQTSKLKDLSRQMETYAQEIESFKTKLVKCEAELETLNQQKLTHDLSVATAAERIQELERLLAEALHICNDWQSKVESVNRGILMSVSQLAESQSRLDYLERREIEVNGRVAKGQSEIDAIDRLRKDFEKKIATSDTDLASLKQLSFKLSDETTQVRQDLEEKRTLVQQEVQKLDTLKNELAAKQSRLNSLQELHNNMDGFRDGVRTVMKASSHELSGIVSPVSEIVDCEPQFEAAISAALGDKLQYVVVESQKAGVEAIDYLRTQAKGRSTFVPLDIRAMEQKTETLEGPGVMGPLLQNIHFSDDYRQIAEYLFGDCILVEDLKQALNLWQQTPQDKTLVTLQGEVIDRSGVISGGMGVEGEALLGYKRRIEEIEKELAQAKAAVSEQEKECWHLKNQVHSREERLESLSRDSHSEDIRIVHQEKDGMRFREELGRYNQERDRLTMEIARCLDEKREIASERDAVARLLEERITKQASLEKELAEFQTEFVKATDAKNQSQNNLSHAQAQLAQAQDKAQTLDRELQQWITNKLELQAGIEKRIAEINLGQTQTQQLTQAQIVERAELEEALKTLDQLTQRQKTLRMEYDTLSNKIKERDSEVREIRRRHEEMVKAKHANDLKFAELRNQFQLLVDQILERYKIDIVHYVPQTPLAEEWNMEEEGCIINELRDRLAKLGSVHVGAIEEYDELKNRYEFLSKQQEDLVQSLEALKRAIQKINRVSRERFLRTFESVNNKFQEIFPRLFKGGKARLILLDEENLMEAGVEIVAQPPGKKLQSISLLSGGEKALTAVALIFSIFLIKPSPFCLLDEVDAPLDDANITRFNDMVREMTSQSQFIVITHNKRTMEKADCLYGITMEEAGVSKVVSVKLNENNGIKEPEAQVA